MPRVDYVLQKAHNCLLMDEPRLQVVGKMHAGSLHPALVRSVVQWRCRPLDEPTWITIPFSHVAAKTLRARAASVGLTVDVLYAMCLDCIAFGHVFGGNLRDGLNALRVSLDGEPIQVGATDAIRSWQRWLSSPAELRVNGSPDELPTVVIPRRLAPYAELGLAVSPENIDAKTAMRCELIASGRGTSIAELGRRLQAAAV